MYVQALIAASLLIGGYQDIKERSISDIVWIPAAVGVLLSFVLLPGFAIAQLVKLVVIGGTAFAFSWFGFIGEADTIALVVATGDPSPLSPIPLLGAAGVIALLHIGYLYVKGLAGKPVKIPIEKFRAEARWIPKAVILDGVRHEIDTNVNTSRESVDTLVASGGPGAEVEVQYGVPTVAYIAAGYVAFLTYLLIFEPSVLLMA